MATPNVKAVIKHDDDNDDDEEGEAPKKKPAPLRRSNSRNEDDDDDDDDEATASTVRHPPFSSEGDNHDDPYWEMTDDPSYLPLLQYATLPTSSSVRLSSSSHDVCTCSAVAQVLLQPGEVETTALAVLASDTDPSRRSHGENETDEEELVSGEQQDPALLLRSDLWKQPHFIMTQGWQSGTVSLMNIVPHGLPIRIVEHHHYPSGGSGIGAAAEAAGPLASPSVASSSTPHPSSATSTDTTLSIREQPPPLVSTGGPSSSPPPPSTVDVSMDATGTFVAGIDQGGTLCIWELKYAPSWELQVQQDDFPSSSSSTSTIVTSQQTRTTTTPSASRPTAKGGGMFSSFLTALTGLPPTPEVEAGGGGTMTDTTSSSAISKTKSIRVPCLAATVISTSRLTYPAHWKPPTCLVIDPAYKKTKSCVVGFQDGRLVHTKRGWGAGGGLFQSPFQRRNDTVLYQGGGGSSTSAGGSDSENVNGSGSSHYRGIECITWRGNLVAWADASGIKLLDMETLTRIAHVDRPTGARPSLYPSLPPMEVRPHLVFETASQLLVVWGDCLMSMDIIETPVPGEGSLVVTRRTVQCRMAWELEGVAAGVAPLDANHVIVLGIIIVGDEGEDDNGHNGDDDNHNGQPLASVASVAAAAMAPVHQPLNELEVQIVSRHDGTIQYADVLPPHVTMAVSQGGAGFCPPLLHSSFALPRMDNASEWNEYKAWSGKLQEDASSAFDLTILTAGSGGGVGGYEGDDVSPTTATTPTSHRNKTGTYHRPRNTFVDPHLQWNIKAITFDGENVEKQRVTGLQLKEGDVDTDSDSVDSDDYGFVLRPLDFLDDTTNESADRLPPTMVIVSASEAIQVTLSNIDDAIEHALVAQNRPALALKRALQHRRQLRRFRISDLVQKYLEALLYLTSSSLSSEAEYLSLRRMKLAVQAMPVLLGGQLDLWTKWAHELEKVPGALFLLRSRLPVRDPILPANLYEQVLWGMWQEYERLTTKTTTTFSQNESEIALDREAAHHILESLLAWGPTKALKEYIKLLQYSRKHGDKSVVESIKGAEIALQRRYLQTAAGYLHFPVSEVSPEDQLISSHSSLRYDAHKDDSQDSLFSLQNVMKWVAPRVPLVAKEVELDGSEGVSSSLALNHLVCLEAMACLRLMHCQYDLAFQAYLAIGASHSPLSMTELETLAITVVQSGRSKKDDVIRIDGKSYDFVLGLVENHHLHRCLLERDFIVKAVGDNSKRYAPLFSLFRLVGLNLAGEFLMEHCVAPDVPLTTGSALYLSSTDESDDFQRKETLPMDVVAAQLESSPALLHWYLHLVFTSRPELYIKFPNSSIPPDTVTELHRKHFQLYLQFAGDAKDSAKVLAGTEPYMVEAITTPLLSFLKAALPLGGISPVDARRQLETLRSEESSALGDGDDDDGRATLSSFAVELAYVIEHYGDQSEGEALAILGLFLDGAMSITLGVAYAQRQRQYSSFLWDKLITHCLSPVVGISSDGMQFGALLEAAALSGADLARLVARIPPGMIVEGLRPRLVAAVADYRIMVDIHQAASVAASKEQMALLREVAHRSRRGSRFMFTFPTHQPRDKLAETKADEQAQEQPSTLPKNLRPIQRRERRTFSLSLPIR